MKKTITIFVLAAAGLVYYVSTPPPLTLDDLRSTADGMGECGSACKTCKCIDIATGEVVNRNPNKILDWPGGTKDQPIE